MEKIELENGIEKPEFFWHGSTNGGIEEFEPRTSHGTGTELGPRVYATPDKIKALPFLASEYIDETWQVSVINEEVFVFIPMTQEEFIARDKGGYLYKLPGADFEEEPEGMGWSSTQVVAPVEKKHIPKVLDAM